MSRGLTQTIYRDFQGGYNNTISALMLRDNELALAENVDFAAEIGAFRTRRGCMKVNQTPLNSEITDGFSWTVGSEYRKCIVVDSKVYQIDTATGSITEKISLSPGAVEIYPFTLNNVFYFGDGQELYVWGGADFTSEQGTKTIITNDIVRNNDSSSGIKGDFYRALGNHGSIDLKTENYANVSRWENVTDVSGLASNVVKKMKPWDPSASEEFRIIVTRGASASGDIIVSLDNVSHATAVAASDLIDSICAKLLATSTPGWDKTLSGNVITYTKTVPGLCENGYVDTLSTGVTIIYDTIKEGKINDNNLDPIKKCTMFVLHTPSMRVFAAGGTGDNALFYSEIGNPTYFNSDICKVYPSSGFGKITALGALSKSIIVSYEDGWYVWEGVTPLSGINQASWSPLNLPSGCVAHRSLTLAPNSFMFLGKDGIYRVDASILNETFVMYLGRRVIQRITLGRLDKTIESIVDKSKCRGVFYDNCYYLAFNEAAGGRTLPANPDGSPPFGARLGDIIESASGRFKIIGGSEGDWILEPLINVITGNTKVIKYEFDTDSFSIITGWYVNQWIRDPESLYFCTYNYLMASGRGYSDIDVYSGDIKPIRVHVKTKEFPLGNEFSYKFVQLVGLVFKQGDTEEESKSDVTLHSGYIKYRVNDIDITESLVYGRSWGLTWGFKDSTAVIIEYTQPSTTYQIEFESTRINDPVTLLGICFTYRQTTVAKPDYMEDEALLI